ncbi:GNAT family N-acetyltransferase [Roseococcus sp. SYP-B2431]|uniref:GNAT family N-acetyltransferase n=1 Tax=Roseococcus sp. SYP-B2431 TaxID=2496640 RepID=UPI001039B5B2|nr:GNAT family N-acetyltransferase [Roseococcus sp. SYP-B2431]TCH96137.1 GNAT family N-acetyltransferase [Roseococcus sp. SYP-B2431]
MKLVGAGPEDAALLAALHATCFPPGSAWDAETLAALLALDGTFALRAGEAGFILARQTLDEAEILTLAVAPAARRGGLGAALVRAALARVAAAGAKAMFLEVAEANAAAIGLYAAAGFARIGLRRDYYAPGSHALAMRRCLSG